MDNSLDHEITLSHILKFVMPSIIMMVFSNIYGMIDGLFVSNYISSDALAAVNVVFPVIMVCIALSTMLGTGGNAIIAKKLGEGKISEARTNMSTIVWTTLVGSIIISVITFIFLEPIIYFLGSNELIYDYCKDYLETLLIFLPFTMLSILFQTFFITIGKSSLGLFFTIIGGLSNIALDYLFIVDMNLGVSGAAAATAIGYCLTGLFGLIYFCFNKRNSLYLVKPCFNFKLLKEASINGSSEMVSSLAASIVTLLLNKILMNLAGVDGVAAITVILYIQGLLSAAFMGYSMGISPLISFNFGKGEHGRLHKLYRISMISIVITSILVFIISLWQSSFLVSVFVDTAQKNVYELSLSGLRIFSISFLFMGINLFASAMFTALSNGKVSAIISFLRTLVFVVVCILIFPIFFGITGVWIAIPVAELLSLIVSLFFLNKYKSFYHY